MDRVRSLREILKRLRGTNFCINCTSSAHFAPSIVQFPNPPKHYKTHQNTSLGSDGVDREDLLQKILTRLCGTNFCINCNCSAYFELSIIKPRKDPKCTQTQRNATKYEYWVQWGGSGAFIANNSNATSGHELLQYLHHTQPILH